MSKFDWTNEQKDAIYKKKSNILVAAAAGSGKTAVLVERIIRKIIDDKIDIDKLLVVTFTNAAASEMRERILDAIYKEIEKNPDDVNLQRQINLINKANISTIDSFCLDVIKNNFFEIDVSANVRVADSTEILLLEQETLNDIFEEKYMNNDKDFLNLIDLYTKYNKDEDLENLILKIYEYSQSNPFPELWIKEKVNMFCGENVENNFSKSIWGKIIIHRVTEIIDDCILKQKDIINKTKKIEELYKFTNILEDDINKYEFVKSNLKDWDIALELICNFKNEDWPRARIDNPVKQEAKESRDKIKQEFEEVKKIIQYNSKQANDDINYMYNVLIELQNIILEFSKRFKEKKLEKNIIDFSDMEHLALNILVKVDENGNISQTDVAKKYVSKFEEIAIDEYQDSNLVQEYILNSISNGKNVFMVGDVKQSIYKFRQARPELFLNKYEEYKLDPQYGENRKIQLFKNFRSRKNILDFTNIIFENIMSKDLGDINYNQSEYLNLGTQYEEVKNQNINIECNIIDLKENENIWKDDETDEIVEDEIVEDIILDARFVANRIKNLIDSKYKIIDKNVGIRNITYRDIAVLLRNANAVAPIYEKEIAAKGINVYSDSSESYLESIEVDTVMSILKIINNPLQDIPLVIVLRSQIFNFTDDELLEISLNNESSKSFYEKMLYTQKNTDNVKLKSKIEDMLIKIKKWRKEAEYKTLDELIWQIYIDTGYMDYLSLLPNGALKVANLKMLFEKAKEFESASFKGLYNFINFINKIKLSSGDFGAAKIIGSNENVVRIMSIHKSKGLEFPVVILAYSNKNFNFQDLNDKILLHQDLGIGPQYIDTSKHIEFPTLARESLKIKLKQEIISEEMRILYVALTRAKEKLIITGIQKDLNKLLDDKSKILEVYKETTKLNPFVVQKCKSYLEWIVLVYLKEGSNKLKGILDFNIIKKVDLLKEEIEEDARNKKIEIEDKALSLRDSIKEKQIKDIFDWEYNNYLRNIPTKTSVTKIKELVNDVTQENTYVRKEKVKPQFLNQVGINKITPAQRGTLMHLCIQKMNEKEEYDINKVKELVKDLIKRELITQIESENIDIDKLYLYTKSELWSELRKAKSIYKEQPFYINIPANKIYFNLDDNDTNVLVQGIIDLYYITQDNKIKLIDYKTDKIDKGEENTLLSKYATQLKVYKEALSQTLEMPIESVGIYSVYTGKIVIIKGEDNNETR